MMGITGEGAAQPRDGEASITVPKVQIPKLLFDLSPSKPFEEINNLPGWIKIEWSSVAGPSAAKGFSNVKINIQLMAIVTQKNSIPLVSFTLHNMAVP